MGKLSRSIALGVALLAVAGTARASQVVLGKIFLVKDPSPGTDPSKRKLSCQANEPGSNDMVMGDPVTNGATVEVIATAAAGGTSSDQVFSMPGGPNWKPISTIGFKYKDSTGLNGPVKSAQIKKTPGGTFQIKLQIKGLLGPGAQPHITVTPPNPGAEGGMFLTILGAGGGTYCVRYGGTAGGNIGGNNAKVFKISKPFVEAGCPTCGGTRMCHDVCTAGAPQCPFCSDCAALVCGQDPTCCDPNGAGSWDTTCVSEVASACNEACSSCSDGMKNGNETDVDCGGDVCFPCADLKMCLVAADCTSGVCTTGICQPPTCLDGVKNGAETDVDCGGGTCPTCGTGQMCSVNADCTSNDCTTTPGTCQ